MRVCAPTYACRPYPWHSVESQMRQLGDLAFLLRQYAFAEATYRLAAQDYLSDGNNRWYAGVEVRCSGEGQGRSLLPGRGAAGAASRGLLCMCLCLGWGRGLPHIPHIAGCPILMFACAAGRGPTPLAAPQRDYVTMMSFVFA